MSQGTELEESPYVLIRHGLSEENFKNQRIKKAEKLREMVKDSPDEDIKKQLEMLEKQISEYEGAANINPGMHPVGIIQCEA